MLVLCRRINQQIKIGDLIKITVVSIRAGSVRIAIDAPLDIPIHRQEVYDAIQWEREDADPEFQIPEEADRVNDFGDELRLPLDPRRDFPSEVQSAIQILARYLEQGPGNSAVLNN